MQPEDVGRLVTVDDLRLSGDGQQVAFVVATVDLEANAVRKAVWHGPTDGRRPPVPCTAGVDRDALPRFSPAGDRLAFTSHRDDGACTLHVLPLAGPGEAVRVATWPEEVDALEWTPDGRTLVFGARVPDEARKGKDPKDQPPRRITTLRTRLDSVGWLIDRPRQLFRVAADGTDAAPTLLTDGLEPDIVGLAMSGDGETVAFAAGRHADWDIDGVRDLFTVPLAGGAPTRLTDTTAVLGAPAFAPDGRHLACTIDRPATEVGNRNVAVVPFGAAAAAARPITTAIDRNVQTSAPRAPVWLDATTLLVSVEDHGDVVLQAVDLDGHARTVVGGERCVTAYDAAGGVVAAAVTEPTVQVAVVVVDVDGGERELCRLGDGLEVVTPVRFSVPTTDGTGTIDAWYLPPARAPEGGSHPALVNIHGGPFTQYGNRFFDELQVQAAAGYGVIACNPRGSSGYGDAWVHAICWPHHPVHPGTGWGTVDADDILAVVDHALERFPSIDPARLGVLGGSYGGYMTTWLAGHTDRFVCGVSERSCNDLYALEGGSSDIATVFRSYTGRRWLDDADTYRRHSPITYVDQISMPLLVLHAEGDLRCTIDQADLLFVALRTLGRPVEYVRFAGESHELSRSGAPRHRVQRFEAILEWFDRHLRTP